MSLTGNRKAFSAAIAFSELGAIIIRLSDSGYNVIVGSTEKKLILFGSYADHPRRLILLQKLGIKSTAAGRYQILARYFDAYKKLLGLKDFSPDSQDAIFLQLLKEQKALDDVDAGRFADGIEKCKNIWASLPGAGYSQHENKLSKLQEAYEAAGGTLA